jgi:hypothetical protein
MGEVMATLGGEPQDARPADLESVSALAIKQPLQHVGICRECGDLVNASSWYDNEHYCTKCVRGRRKNADIFAIQE